MHIRATRLIDAAPERTLALAADFLAWDRLIDSIVELRLLNSGPPNIGSRVLVVRKVGPFKSRQVFELSEVSGTGIVLHSDGPGPGRVVLSLVAIPDSDGTRVTVDIGGQIVGPSGLFAPLLQQQLLREWTTFLHRLSAAVVAPSTHYDTEGSPDSGRRLPASFRG